jgi:hypothetical protein
MVIRGCGKLANIEVKAFYDQASSMSLEGIKISFFSAIFMHPAGRMP